MKSLSHVRLFATPWTVAHQASPSMGFSRQEYWSGLPFPSPGDLPDPGIEPGSPALEADTLTSEPPGKPQTHKGLSQRFSKIMQKTENSRICILLPGPQEGLKTSKRYCFTAPDGSWVGISGLSKDSQNQEWPRTKRTIENHEDTRLTKEG